ncbi:MAG: ferritin-like domain-containing protein, partial [Myxococcales bacterium]|nr:ferritin-like domain-containing protein [Myxococcales bacterium]
DETRHAELAWATVAWALGSGDPSVALALDEAATALRSVDLEIDEASFAPEVLAAHGRLDPRAQAATREDAWREIIGPTLASLLTA